jgi:adenine-specific DNA-methyltransferase
VRLTDARLKNDTRRVESLGESRGDWLRTLLPARALDVYEGIATRCPTLGSFARIGIGSVTGANAFFVLRPSQCGTLGIPAGSTRPVVCRSKHLAGLRFGARDHGLLAKADARVVLLYPPAPSRFSDGVKRYLRSGRILGIPDRDKCTQREPWYRVAHTEVPDAFLQYMAWLQPRLVLNDSAATCTNAVHRVWWHDRAAAKAAKSIALGLLSSVGQLSAELEGRSYGGGVLKLEPSEARRVLVPATRACAEDFDEANRALRDGNWSLAQAIADRALLVPMVGSKEARVLALALERLRRRRHAMREG